MARTRDVVTLMLAWNLAFGIACGEDSPSSSNDVGGAVDSGTTDGVVDGPSDDVQQTEVSVPQEPRSYRMALQAFYYERSTEARDRTWQFIDTHADAVAIVLDGGVPWRELLAGEPFPPGLESDLSEWETLLSDRDLDLFLAVDLFAPDRLGIAADVEGRALPAALVGASAGQPDVAVAYERYCELLMERFEPDYFSPVLDLNEYLLNRPSDYEAAVQTYKDVREALKFIRFETQIFPTWNLELLAGLGPVSDQEQFSEMRKLEPNSDRLGLTITPPTFLLTMDSLAEDHLTQVEQYTSREVVIVGTGYPSVGFQTGPIILPSSENTQFNYLAEILTTAENGRYDLVVWSYPYDISSHLETLCPGRISSPGEACDEAVRFDRLRPYASAGLATPGVAQKEALGLWDEWVARQYVP